MYILCMSVCVFACIIHSIGIEKQKKICLSFLPLTRLPRLIIVLKMSSANII